MSSSGGESESSETNVSAAMSSVEAAACAMLTDSENTNNENRVIEMAATNPPGHQGAVEDADRSQQSAEEAEVAALKGSSEADDTPQSEGQKDGEKSVVSPGGPSRTQDQYAEHVTYNEAGEAIYTDPATKYQYRWSSEKNEWVSLAVTTTAQSDDNPFENEHYRWCHETKKWLPKETATETEHYRWDEATAKWIPKHQPPTADADSDERQYGYEDGVHTYKDKDGAVYFWDDERKAWFPKIDDDFMAMYQLNYGFIDNTSGASGTDASKTVEPPKPIPSGSQPAEKDPADDAAGQQAKGKKRKAPPEPPKWFELAPENNTKVYVSNLPTDISEEEFGEVMSKCGMVMKDPKTHKLKLKLYRDVDGKPKGDGLCHYIKIESVDLALNILDNYDVRGHRIKVQRAEFQMRGEYNPTLKPKTRKKEKERQKKMQQSLFDWRPEKMRGERSKHERIVIIRNLFEPELFDREVHLLLEYQNDLRDECGKCGTVRRVLLYDRHPEGVAQVTMSDPEEADLVVQLMNGRFFGQRKLTAAIWDGRTKFRIAETDADIDKRRGNWEQFLETDPEKPGAPDDKKEPSKDSLAEKSLPNRETADPDRAGPEMKLEHEPEAEKGTKQDAPEDE
ncbi:HIV Tat-specific factor 1 [Anopheles cruzii]|uniref:HIV Tat-specific factor 1 n=1 Tax=Anopheles cruzii TaxID=68878 RepID=UPI0022EC2F3B|nr:HIV Tat-specific factor 1 [Anopheles cruzii]